MDFANYFATNPATATLEALPLVIPEQEVRPFKFFLGNTVREGIRDQDDLYGLTYEFQIERKLIAFQTACELIWQGAIVMITVSEARYRIWVSLRSAAYLHRAKMG